MKKIRNLLNKFIYSKCKNVKIRQHEKAMMFGVQKNITLLTNNCLGGCIYHDFGLMFQSPIVNCFISWLDFPTFVLNLKEYIGSELLFDSIETENRGYPCGCLQPMSDKELKRISVFFNHSNSFEEAKKDFERRKERINNKKIVVIIDTFGKKLNDSFIYEIELISKKYPIKVLISAKNNPDLMNSTLYQPLAIYDQKKYFSGLLCQYRGLSGKRYYEEFDIASFIFDSVR